MKTIPDVYKVLSEESIKKMIDNNKSEIALLNSDIAILHRELKRRKRLTNTDKLN